MCSKKLGFKACFWFLYIVFVLHLVQFLCTSLPKYNHTCFVRLSEKQISECRVWRWRNAGTTGMSCPCRSCVRSCERGKFPPLEPCVSRFHVLLLLFLLLQRRSRGSVSRRCPAAKMEKTCEWHAKWWKNWKNEKMKAKKSTKWKRNEIKKRTAVTSVPREQAQQRTFSLWSRGAASAFASQHGLGACDAKSREAAWQTWSSDMVVERICWNDSALSFRVVEAHQRCAPIFVQATDAPTLVWTTSFVSQITCKTKTKTSENVLPCDFESPPWLRALLYPKLLGVRDLASETQLPTYCLAVFHKWPRTCKEVGVVAAMKEVSDQKDAMVTLGHQSGGSGWLMVTVLAGSVVWTRKQLTIWVLSISKVWIRFSEPVLEIRQSSQIVIDDAATHEAYFFLADCLQRQSLTRRMHHFKIYLFYFCQDHGQHQSTPDIEINRSVAHIFICVHRTLIIGWTGSEHPQHLPAVIDTWATFHMCSALVSSGNPWSLKWVATCRHAYHGFVNKQTSCETSPPVVVSCCSRCGSWLADGLSGELWRWERERELLHRWPGQMARTATDVETWKALRTRCLQQWREAQKTTQVKFGRSTTKHTLMLEMGSTDYSMQRIQRRESNTKDSKGWLQEAQDRDTWREKDQEFCRKRTAVATYKTKERKQTQETTQHIFWMQETFCGSGPRQQLLAVPATRQRRKSEIPMPDLSPYIIHDLLSYLSLYAQATAFSQRQQRSRRKRVHKLFGDHTGAVQNGMENPGFDKSDSSGGRASHWPAKDTARQTDKEENEILKELSSELPSFLSLWTAHSCPRGDRLNTSNVVIR